MGLLFYISLFFAVWFGFVNIIRACKKLDIPIGNFLFFALAIVGLVYSLLG